jgi:hypothetical protein
MTGRSVATATVVLALLAGCGNERERTSQGSPLPAAPEGVADGCHEAVDVVAFRR